jgi:uncharacterized protein YjbI with pentapeptide repeats
VPLKTEGEEVARLWIRRIGRIAIASVLVVVASLALLWATAVLWGPQWWLRLADAPTAIAIAVLASAPLTAVLAAIWWLWWRLPRRQLHRLDIQIHDPKARADAEDNFRKTVGQALGGAAVLIGAGAAFLQFTQQQQASRDQLKAAHDLLISNQASKGFEQLANKDSVVMRVAGIYALEGVMNAAVEYFDPAVEALRIFVRDDTTGNVNRKPRADVQAALTVIGRRADVQEVIWRSATGRVDLSLRALDLSGANIPGADLRNANLSGVNLHGANLQSADMRGANLSMFSASGDSAVTYPSGVDLSNANLSGANLQNANLQNANLQGANLQDADMRDANLSSVYRWGRNNSISYIAGTNLSDADLSSAINLTQEQLDQACGKPKALPPGLALDKPCSRKPGADISYAPAR